MPPSVIREIAEAVVRDQLLFDWRFYLVLAALTVVASAFGSWITSYYKKRGETLATKSDFDEIRRQLAATTEVTEQVRSAISQADWIEREWRTTRRVKLEELLSAAYATENWLEAERKKWIHDEDVTASTIGDVKPLDRLTALASLYFPELTAEINAFRAAAAAVRSYMFDHAGPITEAKNNRDLTALGNALAAFTSGWHPSHEAFIRSRAALEMKAMHLMRDVSGVNAR